MHKPSLNHLTVPATNGPLINVRKKGQKLGLSAALGNLRNNYHIAVTRRAPQQYGRTHTPIKFHVKPWAKIAEPSYHQTGLIRVDSIQKWTYGQSNHQLVNFIAPA